MQKDSRAAIMKRFVYPALFFAIAMVAGCSVRVTDNGGGSSSTTNTFAMAVDSGRVHGTAAPGTRVTIYSSDYQAVFGGTFCDSMVCGPDSVFDFPGLQPGSYCVLAADAQVEKAKYVGIILVPPQNGSIRSLSDTLGGVREIRGIVRFDPSGAGPVNGATVCILGTPFYCFTDSTGVFVLAGVPEGNYLVQAAAGRQAVPKVVKYISTQDNDFAFVTVGPDSAAGAVSLMVR
jgi:hypothetical protein